MLPGRPERAPRDNYHHGVALRTSSCPAGSSAVGQQVGLGGLRILPGRAGDPQGKQIACPKPSSVSSGFCLKWVFKTKPPGPFGVAASP